MASDPAIPPIAAVPPNRRALILPGGGMRVAYQAGAVRELYEEGLRFSYADGASGGTMNLAALLGGATPGELCRRWRTLDVRRFVSLRPLGAYARFPNTGALGDFDGIEAHVFPHLGIDADRVRRATNISATFDVCDFGEKVAVAVPHREMSHDLLLAAISLPLATPPVTSGGRTWTDAVWIRDCDPLATIRAGANELWIIWCIGNTPTFRSGLLEQYVHMIEMAAVGRLNADLEAIADLNKRIRAGERPYGHDTPIVVHVVRPDTPIPLDPDFLFGRIDAATLIAYGSRDAARYLSRRAPGGIALDPSATKMRDACLCIAFRETMKGRITFGATEPESGYAHQAAVSILLHASIDIADVRAFVQDPAHRGALVGHVDVPVHGGMVPARGGRFALFAPTADRDETSMVYEMAIRIEGVPHYFAGHKRVRIGPPWRLWPETTTLYVTIHAGENATGAVVAAGILYLGAFDLVTLLGTLRATGCEGLAQRASAVARFLAFFASGLYRTFVARRRA